MTIVDSFGQAYHWTMDYTLGLTLPQIIMINAGADVNKKRMDRRVAQKHADKPAGIETPKEMPRYMGKPIDALTTKEYLLYHATGMAD